MKQINSYIQTGLLAAICALGVLVYINTKPEQVDPQQALRETLYGQDIELIVPR